MKLIKLLIIGKNISVGVNKMRWKEYQKTLNNDPEYLKAKENLRLKFALGDIVLQHRLEKGLSQAELARRIGTKQANISKVESGLSNPTLEFIEKLGKVLDFPICFEYKVNTEYAIVTVREPTNVKPVSDSLSKVHTTLLSPR